MQTATLGGGCFWCTEAIFKQLRGVTKVTSGYTGGETLNPTYEQVSTGTTGHAEAIQIEFDPQEIKFADLLEVFWHLHDPTTLNQQGADIGTQYRSAIFYHDSEQQRIAEESKRQLDQSHEYESPAVTEIVPLSAFYPAEAYHADFYAQNPTNGYCRVVISPKLQKLRTQYAKLI